MRLISEKRQAIRLIEMLMKIESYEASLSFGMLEEWKKGLSLNVCVS
jgi:hypothetical protein